MPKPPLTHLKEISRSSKGALVAISTDDIADCLISTNDELSYHQIQYVPAAIRSNNITFTIGTKDPLIEKPDKYEGVILEF